MEIFEKTPKNVPTQHIKAFRARQRLMLFADIMEIAIVENFPDVKLSPANVKMRPKMKQVHRDIEAITRALGKEILHNTEDSTMGSKNYAFAFYTIVNALKDWPEDELYELAKDIVKQNEEALKANPE